MKQFIVSIIIIIAASLSLHGQIMLGVKDVKCHGEKNGKVTVLEVKNAIHPLQNYAWSTGASGATKKSIENVGAGTYRVTVTDAMGCTAEAEAVVGAPPSNLKLDIVSSADQFFVCGTSSIIVVASPSGGTPPYTTNGDNGAFATRVSLASFGNGPKFLDFQTTDAHGCSVKHRQYFAFSAVSCASDPNDITGPLGIDEGKWVAGKDRIDYAVRFENDPDVATAPAQVVKVTVPVHEKINPLSIRLGNFGWGPFQFTVPALSTYYQQRLDLRDSLNLYVDVTAGYNIVANEYFWIFEAIDPQTGQLPQDPQRGFLPVNDTLTGSGEGYILFSVLPKTPANTGDMVTAQAEIIFDINEPIVTNVWENTLDAVAPSSQLAVLPDTLETDAISLMWVASDDPGGVGIRDFELYVSIDGGPMILAEREITGNSIEFPVTGGATYSFIILATDRVGNKENLKANPETTTYVVPIRQIELIHPAGHDLCIRDSLTIRWSKTTTESVMVELSLDSMDTWMQLAITSADSLTIYLADSMVANDVFLRFTDLLDDGIVTLSHPLAIHVLPEVDAGADRNICSGSATILSATGANQYIWDTHSALNLPNVYNPRATPLQATTFYVTGIDVFGCTDRDSVHIGLLATFTDTVVVEICDGDSLFVGGAYQYEAGYFTDELAATTGCDSTVVTEIVITGPCPFASQYVYVDQDAMGLNNGTSWENAFNDLQDALDVVENYWNVREIWIAEGNYVPTAGNDRYASFMLRDSVVIYGGFLGFETQREGRVADPSLVRISGDIGLSGDSTDNTYHVVIIDSSCNDCRMDGLTVSFGHANNEQANGAFGAGLYVMGKALLEGLVIERNTTLLDGAAIFNTGPSAKLTLRNCIFRLNDSGLERDILNANGAEIFFEGMNILQD